MAKSIQLDLKTVYDAKGVRAMLADVQALQKAMAQIGRGGGSTANPFGSFVTGARTAETEIARFAKAQREALKAPAGKSDPYAPVATSAQKAERQLLQLASAQARLQSAQGNAAGAIQTLSTAIGQVDKRTVPAIRAMTQLQAAQNAVDKSSRAAAGGFQVLPRTIDGLSGPALTAAKALGAITIALAGLRSAGAAIAVVANTEQTLNVLQATAGASAAQMQQAAATAQALGADLTLPATSANTAAQAMLELTKAGLSVEESMAAARGTLQLAAAGQMAEADAAKITANALNAFGLAASDAGRVADLLAAGANASSASMTDLSQGIQQGGFAFAASGQRIEDLTTSLAILTNVGLTGSDAGTALKNAMIRLMNPTQRAAALMDKLGINVYNAQGQMLPLRDIIGVLNTQLGGMTQQQRNAALGTIFLSDGMKAMIPLMRAGVSGFDTMLAAVSKQGTAGVIAAAQMQGLNGAIAALQSQVETLASAALTPLLPLMTNVVNAASALAGQLQGPVGTGALALAGAIRSLAGFISANAIPALTALTAVSAAYAAAQVPAMIAAVTQLISTMGAATAAFIANNAAMIAGVGMYAVVAAAVFYAAQQYQAFGQQVSSGADALLQSRQWWQDSAAAIQQYTAMLQQTGQQQDQVDPKIRGAATTVQILRDQIKGELVDLAKRQAAYDAWKNTTGIVSPGDEKALQDRRDRINQLAKGLQQATTYLNGLTGAQMQAMAAGITASAVYQTQQDGISTLGDAAQLTAAEIDKLAQAIATTMEQGTKALGDYVSTNSDFTKQVEQLTANHAAKLAQLEQAAGAAKTDAARQAIQDKIAAENDGYAQELQAQAGAYAQQAAAQRAFLGQMLIDYTVQQAQLGNIAKDRAAALVAGIKQQYGVVGDTISAAFLEATGVIDQFGANTATSVGQATSAMGRVTDASVALQQRIAAVQQQRIIDITAQFRQDNNLEAYQAALEALPSQVATEVQLDNAAANASMSDYIRSTQAIPTSVNTVVTATTAPAQANIADIDKALRAVPKDTPSTITVDGRQALATTGAVKGELGSIPGNVRSTITIETRRIESNRIASGGAMANAGGAGAVGARAGGGSVWGPGTGTSDSIPTMLSNGEFVVRASQANKYRPLLNAINSGAAGYADGGTVGTTGTPVQSSRASLALQATALGVTAGATPAEVLAEQQQTNATLQGDLQQYLDDALKAAQDYQQQRLDIEKKFQSDLAAQIQENNVSKYESRADFYDNLTQATKDIGQQQAQALAASYEEWYAKARTAEQNGQANLAKSYEDYANKQLGRELEYQKKVADIKQGGITKEEQAELDRMAAIKQLRDQAAQAELSNINQNGDSIQQARDDALSQADRSYQERQAELETRVTDAFGKTATAATGASSIVVSAVDAQTSAVQRLRDALQSLPIEKTVSVNVSQNTNTSAAPGGTAAAGGGTFVTTGRATLTVGDNPGGQELVQVTPLSGRGTTRVGAGMLALAGGGTVIAGGGGGGTSARTATAGGSAGGDPVAIVQQAAQILDVLARNANRKQIFQLKDYRLQLEEAALILSSAAQMSRLFARPLQPIDPRAVQQLAADLRTVVDVFAGSIIKNVKSWNYLTGQYKATADNAIGVLESVAGFRKDFKASDLAPLDLALIQELAGQANQIVRAITGVLLPSYSWQNNQLDAYAEALSKELDILNGVADLRRGLADPVPPLDVAQITALAQQTQAIGAAIGGVLVPIAQASLDDVTAYAEAVSKSVQILGDMAGLARDLKEPTPPINLAQIQALAQETRQVGGVIGSVMVPVAEAAQQTLDQYGAAVRGSVDILTSISDLRTTLTDADAQGPLDIALVTQLAMDARQALYYVQGSLLVYTQQAQAELTQYADMAKNAIDTLRGVADLRKSVTDSGGPLDIAMLQRMAQDAYQATYYVMGAMLTATQDTADGLSRYAQMASDAVGVLKNIADLRKSLSAQDGQTPIDVGLVQRLASEAQQVTQIVTALLVPTTQDQADALSRWQSAVGSGVAIVKDAADLARSLAQPVPPLRADAVQRLAAEAQDVTRVLQGMVVPTTQDQADALSRWQSAVTSSVGIVKDTLGLSSAMWTDYQSPSDAQIQQVARDADRVVRAMAQAATTYSTDGLTNAKAYADAVGSTFGAFKDGLLFFDALKSGDFGLDTAALARFEADATQAMAVAGRLEAMAQTTGSTALAGVMDGLNTAAQTLMTLADLPRVDWGQLAANTGGATNTIYNNFYLPDGSDAQTAQYVMSVLNQQMGMHQ